MLSTYLEQLDREGYVVIEDALDAAQVARLTAVVDRIAAEHDAPGAPVHELEIADRDPALTELLVNPAVLPVIATALGWNIHLYHSHIDVHPPVSDPVPVWRWHQDGGRQNLELECPVRPRLSLKAGYFLTDVCEPGRGNMLVIPGSHRRNTLDRSVDPPPGAVPLLAPAGAACVFDRRLWHARSDNRSAITRKVVFLGFTYRWVRARHSHDPQVAADPVQRQLLGGSGTPLGAWIPDPEDVPLRAWMRDHELVDVTNFGTQLGNCPGNIPGPGEKAGVTTLPWTTDQAYVDSTHHLSWST